MTIEVEGTAPSQHEPVNIALAPWETRVLDIMNDLVGHGNGYVKSEGGISITHSGAPGAVLARMFISEPGKGYSAANSFIDPETTASQRWHGSGLRLKNLDGAKLEPVMTVRNTAPGLSRIQGRIIYTRSDGTTGTVDIPQKPVAAGKTKTFSMENLVKNLPSDATYGGIELEYDTPNGTVVTSVQSISQNGDHVFQVPMFDPQNMPSSAGGAPWKGESDNRTIVYIKNETDMSRNFIVHLKYDGGQYTPGIKEIKPRQTVAIDFQELRDRQIPDDMGSVIPLDIMTGQIAWSARGREAKTLSGRSEQISMYGGVVNTYSCFNCCENSTADTWINPQAAAIVREAETWFMANQTETNCYQQQYGPFVANVSMWSSTETDVATVSDGLVYGAGVGYSEIGATVPTVLWFHWGGGYCEPWYDEVYRHGSVEVVGVEKIQYKVGSTWTDIPSGGIGPVCNGTSVSFKAIPTSGSFPSSQPTWSGDASGNGVEKTVTFSTAGSRTVSATAGNSVSTMVNVGPANANITLTWLAPAVTTNTGSGQSTASAAPFVPEYIACADLGTNEWKLRVKKVEAKTNITIYTGGFRDPSANPPISQTEAIDANTKMNAYYTSGVKQSWHTTAASEAHENYHNTEWTCTANHYWGPTETALELLKVSYASYNSEAAAITQIKAAATGADAKMAAFRTASLTYWGTLADNAASRPYAAGQIVLNGHISTIVTLAATNNWTGVPGVATANPNVANPCYQQFSAYNP